MTELSWKLIKYFKPGEFDSPDAPGSGTKMDLKFVIMLDQIRAAVGKPLRVNSGYRTLAHNKAVGGVGDSAHTRGLAVDLHVVDGEMRSIVLDEAAKLGIKRKGIGDNIVHLDIDYSLPHPRTWLY